MSEYVIVSILQKDAPTTFHKSGWPLHMTIIRPFSSLKSSKDFLDTISMLCSNKKVITTKGKSYEMFGSENDVSVTELDNVPEIQSLHDEIMHACDSWMNFKMPAYGTYKPHVANQGDMKIDVGEGVLIDSISLVEMIDGNRKVLGTIKFQ